MVIKNETAMTDKGCSSNKLSIRVLECLLGKENFWNKTLLLNAEECCVSEDIALKLYERATKIFLLRAGISVDALEDYIERPPVKGFQIEIVRHVLNEAFLTLRPQIEAYRRNKKYLERACLAELEAFLETEKRNADFDRAKKVLLENKVEIARGLENIATILGQSLEMIEIGLVSKIVSSVVRSRYWKDALAFVAIMGGSTNVKIASSPLSALKGYIIGKKVNLNPSYGTHARNILVGIGVMSDELSNHHLFSAELKSEQIKSFIQVIQSYESANKVL